jgi:MFS family permease
LQFLPAPLASLLGGSVADARDRRSIVLAAQTIALACSVTLAILSHLGMISLPVLFALVVVAATASSFEAPARQATLPTLVPPNELAGAVTVFVTANALAFMSGPALGGLIVGHASVAAAYSTAAALYVMSIALVSRIPKSVRRADQPKRAVNLSSIREGIDFVRKEPVLLACMSLDMFAVLFGGASALLPVFANDILHVGAKGYGLLTSSLEIGGLVTSFVLLSRRPIGRLGRSLVITVAVFGLATITFGLSRSFPLSIAAYMAVGMADQVSVVVRGTIVQMSTPDALRGRVSSVNMLFIGASNQLGAAESGFVASLTTPTFSVVSGGAMCLVVVAVVSLAIPRLFSYRSPT